MQIKKTLIFVLFSLTIIFQDAFAANNKQNDTVLIIGGTKNIGKQIAIKFAEAGYKVWATSRDGKSEYKDDIAKYKINVLKLDVTNHANIKKIIRKIYNEDGKINVLVNNAGYGLLGAAEAVTIEQVKKQFEVNFYGPIQVIQEVLPIMRKQGSGHIINISSTSGIRAVPGLGMYAASKMALEGFSEALVAEVAPWNIKVSVIQPGTVKNNWINNCIEANINNIKEYNIMTTNLKNNLIQKATNGQNQTEIGQLVLDVAINKNPNFRYETNEQSKDVAKSVYLDPQGNIMRDKMIAFAKDLYQN